MDLNAAHYPDKIGAVAGQWPAWLAGWQATQFWQVDRGRHSSASYLMDPADRSSSTGLPLWGHWRGWKWDAAEPHNDMSSSGSLWYQVMTMTLREPCTVKANYIRTTLNVCLKSRRVLIYFFVYAEEVYSPYVRIRLLIPLLESLHLLFVGLILIMEEILL